MKERVLIGWSGGKDAAMALYEIKRAGESEAAALLTTITEGYERISMHGVRRELLVQQADAVGIPLDPVYIPQACTNEIYQERMREALEKHQRAGIGAVVFGDLYLQDIRAYREERMQSIGMRCIFPVWNRPTAEYARQFIDYGFRAVVVCVDTQALAQDFIGREYDLRFLEDLPGSVDPCGENGEFHTFVYDGPIFKRPVRVKRGEKVLRENRFFYCDLQQ